VKLEESFQLNPRYENAPYEFGYMDRDGKIITGNVDPYPARFETPEAAQEFMEAVAIGVAEGNKKFRKLAVPYFLVTRPDGSTYESW
jgi:hypothetical protein